MRNKFAPTQKIPDILVLGIFLRQAVHALAQALYWADGTSLVFACAYRLASLTPPCLWDLRDSGLAKLGENGDTEYRAIRFRRYSIVGLPSMCLRLASGSDATIRGRTE